MVNSRLPKYRQIFLYWSFNHERFMTQTIQAGLTYFSASCLVNIGWASFSIRSLKKKTKKTYTHNIDLKQTKLNYINKISLRLDIEPFKSLNIASRY